MKSTGTAYLSLGSNMGDRRQTLRTAVAQLTDLAIVSSLYETDPVGGPDQDMFLNLVVKLETDKTPHALLECCQKLEADAGRRRLERWGPRTLDVDVLLVKLGEVETEKGNVPEVRGFVLVDEPDLAVPHPRLAQRNFVLAPLLEIAPELAGHELLSLPKGETPVGEVRSLGAL